MHKILQYALHDDIIHGGAVYEHFEIDLEKMGLSGMKVRML